MSFTVVTRRTPRARPLSLTSTRPLQPQDSAPRQTLHLKKAAPIDLSRD
jgi:hypothetical protein